MHRIVYLGISLPFRFSLDSCLWLVRTVCVTSDGNTV